MTEKIVDMLEFLRPKIEIDWQVSLFTPIYVILHCLKERNKIQNLIMTLRSIIEYDIII